MDVDAVEVGDAEVIRLVELGGVVKKGAEEVGASTRRRDGVGVAENGFQTLDLGARKTHSSRHVETYDEGALERAENLIRGLGIA